jgi:SET domain-containing protein
MDHPAIEVRDTNHYGLALFTVSPIVKDEVIVVFEGLVYEAESASALPNEPPDYVKNHAIQIGPTTFRDSTGAGRYLSHSCEPNCGVKGENRIVAMRDISAGEELSFDYAMTEDSDWTMQCDCGSDLCRGIVTGYRDLPAEFRARYEGYISSWLTGSE